jgi:hypothetical protein
MRHDLKVPFADKDAAKKLGARWDAARKIWYRMLMPSMLFWHQFGTPVPDLNAHKMPAPRLAKWLAWQKRFIPQMHRSLLLRFQR